MTQVEILTLIDQELITDHIKTELSDQKLSGQTIQELKTQYPPHQTAINNNGIIAWWQCNEAGKEEVHIRIKEKKVIT